MDSLDRILSLPIAVTIPPPRLRSLPGAPPLLPAQVAAASALQHSGSGPLGRRGLLGLIGCGHGKTLICQLAVNVLRPKSPLILVPASLRKQSIKAFRSWHRWYPTDLRLLNGACVLTHEKLSSPGRRDELERRRPDLIIIDEAQFFANEKSARWKRMARYLAANPHTQVIALSGTLLTKSLKDIRHLATACLKDHTPLPVDDSLQLWRSVIDPNAEPSWDEINALSRLAHWADEEPTQEGIRRAFRKRLETTPGVVVYRSEHSDVSLQLRLADHYTQDDTHQAHINRLVKSWELPDGTMLVDALEFDRHSRTLPIGFFGRFVPPVDEGWLAARSAWGSTVRRWVTYGGFDSPREVCDAAERGDLPAAHQRQWQAWLDVRHLAPGSEAVWVDNGVEHLLSTVLTWLRGRKSGIVWYKSLAVGRVLRAILPVYGSGDGVPAEPLVALSAHVYGTGFEGQQWHDQLVLELPAYSKIEQLLARTHRTGQTEDVTADFAMWSELDRDRWANAIARANWLHETTGERQRILYADIQDSDCTGS